MCIGMANGGKTPKELTDKEITKALECCTQHKCNECPYLMEYHLVCNYHLYKDILALINRQQSAIDVYMQENDRLKTAYIQVSMDRDKVRTEVEKLRADKVV